MPHVRHWPWMALVAAAALAATTLAETGGSADATPRAGEPRPLTRHSIAPGTQSMPRSTATDAGGWVRTTGALAAVVALIVLLAWGYRRAAGLPAGVARGRNLGLVEVVSRAALTPRLSLWLVRVGPRLVLVGGGAEGLRPLDVISDANTVAGLLGEAAQRRPDSSVAAFASALADESKNYARHDDGAAALDAPQLDAVRSKLAQTLERLAGRATSSRTV